MKKIAKTFKALSEDTRLRILNILLERDCCVCELMQVLDLTQSKTSRHLITLCNAGFLKSNRQSFWTVYSIDWDSMNKQHINLIKLMQESLKDNQTAILDRQKLATTTKIALPICSCKESKNGCKN